MNYSGKHTLFALHFCITSFTQQSALLFLSEKNNCEEKVNIRTQTEYQIIALNSTEPSVFLQSIITVITGHLITVLRCIWPCVLVAPLQIHGFIPNKTEQFSRSLSPSTRSRTLENCSSSTFHSQQSYTTVINWANYALLPKCSLWKDD